MAKIKCSICARMTRKFVKRSKFLTSLWSYGQVLFHSTPCARRTRKFVIFGNCFVPGTSAARTLARAQDNCFFWLFMPSRAQPNNEIRKTDKKLMLTLISVTICKFEIFYLYLFRRGEVYWMYLAKQILWTESSYVLVQPYRSRQTNSFS